jgi:adenylylsulfate kinase
VAGGIVWLTGLSGAGKSTLATEVGRQLAASRASGTVEVLDGDEIRVYLSQGLGFTREDRDINVHRIAYVARLLAKHGVLVLAAVISPYADTRAAIARLSREAGHAFVEVFVNAPLATVAERDVKGLYKKALAGEIGNFTGVSDPYEAPENPAIEVRTDRESLAESAAKIVEALRARGLV